MEHPTRDSVQLALQFLKPIIGRPILNKFHQTISVSLFLVVLPSLCQQSPHKIYPQRWTYANAWFDNDQGLAELTKLAHISAQHGMTGIVLAGIDRISLKGSDYIARLVKFRQLCDQLHLEIIPSGFNTGYAGAILAHDRNLAEGLAVKDALFVVRGREAHFVPDSPVRLLNGGFEEHDGNRLIGFTIQDEPGHATFVDTTVVHSGKASLRIENFGAIPGGIARVAQQLRVKPYRCYRVSAWVRTENAAPDTLFSIKAYTPDHRDLSPFEPPLSPTSQWTKVTTAFNSWYADRVFLNIGVFEGVHGKVWVDDVTVEEVGLMNVLRRSGTPLQVRDEKTGTVYQEGRDYSYISDPNLDFQWTHAMPVIHILNRDRIRDGARLRVDYYHGTTIYHDQVVACPSDNKVFAIWQQQFPLIEKYIAPKKYFLALDEIRALNRDESCRKRHLQASAVIGDVINRLYKMVRTVNPKADIYVWSDMFDPNHNAVKQYYLVDGDLRGTWEYLPKDVRIVCWYYEKRRESLDFFSSHGFKTIAAAYYDADDLKNPEGWLSALDQTPGAEGIMYTTWLNKYQLLPAFGDLVSKR